MHDGLRRGRRIALAISVVAVAGLTGCRTDRKLTEPDPVPVTKDLLTDALVTADDLPAGITAVDGPGTPISEEVVPEHECDDVLTDLEPKEAVSSDFTGTGITLTDTVAWFPGQGGAAEQAFRDVAAKCSQVVVADQGLAIRAARLNFGVLTDNVLPIRIEVEPASGAITERDLIVMRKGDLLHLIRLTGPRPSDKALLDTAVRVALGRLGELYQLTT